MDGMLRALERRASGGDSEALARLRRLREKLSRWRKLAPCITLCPHGHQGSWRKFRGNVPREQYVSIYFTMGQRWQDMPLVYKAYSIPCKLAHDFFLSSFKKHKLCP